MIEFIFHRVPNNYTVILCPSSREEDTKVDFNP